MLKNIAEFDMMFCGPGTLIPKLYSLLFTFYFFLLIFMTEWFEIDSSTNALQEDCMTSFSTELLCR